MLSKEEKAYCRALEALQNKDYQTADKEFERCRSLYADSKGFHIIAEATRMLAFIRAEQQKQTITASAIEETFSHGEETVVRGQSEQEETR
jgi:outer membrane protein assembly factor BamD (BamD/ComL family)